MRQALLICALLLAATTTAVTQGYTPQQIFNAARAQVFDNIRRAPRYTCVENVTRVQYRPQYFGKLKSCPAYIDARDNAASVPPVRWHDRLRLDVAVLNGQETFAWAGARKFESSQLDDLVSGGTTGTGDFFSFLIAVFGGSAEDIAYKGVQSTPLGLLGVFNYHVPLNRSHYQYHTGRVDRVLAYHGAFWLDSQQYGLRRLVVESDEAPDGGDLCRVRNTMDYARVKIGGSEFLLPEVTTMEVVYNDGSESKNETRFSGCHEYVGESSIRFDDPDDAAAGDSDDAAPLRALPSGLKLQIGLTTKIDTATAAAGDEIIAVPLRDVRDKKLGVLVKTTDRIHGRILRLEQFMTPTPQWILALRFDTLERNGVEQALSLKPLDDGDRPRPLTPVASTGNNGRVGTVTIPGIVIAPSRPAGGGIFMFAQRRELELDRSFHSEWETR